LAKVAWVRAFGHWLEETQTFRTPWNSGAVPSWAAVAEPARSTEAKRMSLFIERVLRRKFPAAVAGGAVRLLP
jgi:hypothetical protein